jgi:hypothetical protein
MKLPFIFFASDFGGFVATWFLLLFYFRLFLIHDLLPGSRVHTISKPDAMRNLQLSASGCYAGLKGCRALRIQTA